MYYEITNNEVKNIKFENISSNNLCVAYIDLIELEKIYSKLNLDKQIITECENNNKYSKTSFEIYEDHYFAITDIKNSKDINKDWGKLGIILKKNLIIIISINKKISSEIDDKILDMLKNIKTSSTLEQILSFLINILIDGYFEKIYYIENRIMSIEKELLKKDLSSSLNTLIFSIKK